MRVIIIYIMSNQNYPISKEGLERLKNELAILKTEKRPAVIERIQSARALGDLSENSEYDDARNEQSFVEGRIKQLEDMIKKARVVSNNGGNVIIVGSQVEVEINGSSKLFQIVSANEVDPLRGKISNDSPIGKALFGKKVGDVFEINAPAGDIKIKIIKIS
ncbi:MAG: Transcription elongation factor GreA [Berkelbacteria bacterium GW2011_GWA2_35_9]|uniref:Transcription elongation factor GreA n=1 Tax=Berkelbacteria bacterium GW2011_GWA2_35_9 TaxID=1618333 RepID=A0A0G0GBS6_9BACT|nr:MAG: Transcription elongation factor GreA [Berkelbacteria bacterium GW2011_GWA2_35_9]